MKKVENINFEESDHKLGVYDFFFVVSRYSDGGLPSFSMAYLDEDAAKKSAMYSKASLKIIKVSITEKDLARWQKEKESF